MDEIKNTIQKQQRVIVIVEVNDNVAKLISKTLGNEGFRTKTFRFGSAAVFYLLENDNSLLLMEYFLPDMTAKELIQSLQANKKNIPFIIMSIPGNEKTVIEMMKMGARDVLIKEKGFMELLPSTIHRAFDQIAFEEKLQEVEQSLQRSRDRFQNIFESIIDAIYIYDFNGTILEVNKAALLRSGLKPEDMLKMNYLDLQPYSFKQKFPQFIKKLSNRGQLRFETVEIDGYKKEIPVGCVARIIKHNGNDAILTIARDISEEKQVKNLLEQSEKRFHRITNTISDYIVTVDIENNVPVRTEHSTACEIVTGYSPQELTERPVLWIEMVYDKDKDFVLDNVKKIFNGMAVKPFEHRIVKKDGTLVWLRNTPVLHFDEENILVSYDGVIQDITELKAIEEKLLKHQAHLDATVKAFDGLIYVCSADYKVSYVNEKMIAQTGYDPTGELCYKALFNRDEVCLWCVNDQVQKGETVKREVKCPNNNHWYSIVNTPIYHHDGSISKQALIVDITEKKYAEQELFKLNNLYFGLLDELDTPICRFNANGEIITSNEAFYKLLLNKNESQKNTAKNTENNLSDYLAAELVEWTKECIKQLGADLPVLKKMFQTVSETCIQDHVWIIKAIFNPDQELIEFQGILKNSVTRALPENIELTGKSS